jgi:hypothetical protein
MSKTDDKLTNGTHKQNGKALARRASASTLNSSSLTASTPSTTPATSTIEEINGPTPAPASAPAHARPQRPNVDPVKRYSTNGVASPGSTGSNSSLNRTSLLAPRVLSVSDHSWVYTANWVC